MMDQGADKSFRKGIAVGLATAFLFVLPSCESSTVPEPLGVRDVSASLSRAEAASEQPGHAVVIVGTGDPHVDVPAVQAAVDQGGEVVLKGHFAFDAPPTKSVAPILASAAGGTAPSAEVLIAKGVSIASVRDEQGGMATIVAGTIPFYIDAPGQHVTIRGLRFVRPTSIAILVHAVSGLEIVSTRIEGVVPFAHLGQGISVSTSGIPTPTSPGNPELVSGTLRIERNDIDVIGGMSGADNTLGVTVFSAGVAGSEVDAHVAGNSIRNTTEPAINFRRLVGRAAIEHNVIRTGSATGTAPRNQAIRVANIGSYLVAHNSISCEWAAGDAEGIGVFSQFAAWPIRHTVIVDNDIRMRPPENTVFTAFSAGIGVYGFADSNVVRHNRIQGAALAALSIPSVFPLAPQAFATPRDNTFIRNRFVDFTPLDADIFVGEHALGTRIVGRGTVDDRGTGTVIVRSAAKMSAD